MHTLTHTPNKNYIKGRNFEFRVCDKFRKAGWPYVKRSYGSKGVADIVAIKQYYDLYHYAARPLVAFIQCKFEADIHPHSSEKEILIEYANKCGAIPIWAISENRRIKLINLQNGKEFRLDC